MTDPLNINRTSTDVKFYGRKIRYQSLVPVQIEVFAGHNSLGNATGFFIDNEGSNVLVTNWHVLAGRNTETGQPLHKSGAIPDTINIKIHSQAASKSDENQAQFVIAKIKIVEDDKSKWLAHPEGQKVDIGLVRVSSLPPETLVAHANSIEARSSDFGVGEDVFILGFPEGFPLRGELPIWKRGTIAAETLIREPEIAVFS